jgi:hypothetical protein
VGAEAKKHCHRGLVKCPETDTGNHATIQKDMDWRSLRPRRDDSLVVFSLP